jgi:hypothetical protein
MDPAAWSLRLLQDFLIGTVQTCRHERQCNWSDSAGLIGSSLSRTVMAPQAGHCHRAYTARSAAADRWPGQIVITVLASASMMGWLQWGHAGATESGPLGTARLRRHSSVMGILHFVQRSSSVTVCKPSDCSNGCAKTGLIQINLETLPRGPTEEQAEWSQLRRPSWR